MRSFQLFLAGVTVAAGGAVAADSDLERVIATADVNKDGVLNEQELMEKLHHVSVLRISQHTSEALQEVAGDLDEHDKNKDGKLSFEETRAIVKLLPVAAEEKNDPFAIADSNRDGYLDLQELRVLKHGAPVHIDADGVVSNYESMTVVREGQVCARQCE
jgi:Ca2+-binding EF-hand superfamily protein